MTARIRRIMAMDCVRAHFGDDGLPLIRLMDEALIGTTRDEVIFSTAEAVYRLRILIWIAGSNSWELNTPPFPNAESMNRLAALLCGPDAPLVDGFYWSPGEWALALEIADLTYEQFVLGEVITDFQQDGVRPLVTGTRSGMPFQERVADIMIAETAYGPITEAERLDGRRAKRSHAEWLRAVHIENLASLKESIERSGFDSPLYWGSDLEHRAI